VDLSQADHALHRLGQLDRIESQTVFEYQLHHSAMSSMFCAGLPAMITRSAAMPAAIEAYAVVFTQINRAILGRDVDGLDGRETRLDKKVRPLSPNPAGHREGGRVAPAINRPRF